MHTKNNISLLLAKSVVRIVSETRNAGLNELMLHLLQRKEPDNIIN